MDKPKMTQKSPYVVTLEPGTYKWCSCGESANQPYCDGAHKGTEFRPVIETITEEKTVAWCGCRQSGKVAFCDGTHKTL